MDYCPNCSTAITRDAQRLGTCLGCGLHFNEVELYLAEQAAAEADRLAELKADLDAEAQEALVFDDAFFKALDDRPCVGDNHRYITGGGHSCVNCGRFVPLRRL